MNKTISSLIMFVILMLLNINISMAQDNDVVTSMGFGYTEIDGMQVPVGKEVTIDQATEYVEQKGYQLIAAIQKIAKPITLVVMVGCGLMAVISGLGGGANKGGSGSWMWAAVVSALCYTAIVFSPVILDMIVTFMKPY